MRCSGVFSLISIYLYRISFNTVFYFNTCLCTTGDIFHQYSGHLVDNCIAELVIQRPTGANECCVLCVVSAKCDIVSYNNVNRTCRICRFSQNGDISFQISDDWDSWYKKADMRDGWIMVFKGVAGNGVDVADAWTGVPSITSYCLDPYDATCTSHYRSGLIDRWEELQISEVKVELYTEGNHRVVYMMFDGRDTNSLNWFSQATLTNSSWAGLKSDTLNIFSINFDGSDGARHFYINKLHNGCPKDTGWLIVIDVNPPRGSCSYDSSPNTPAFIYSRNSSGSQWLEDGYGTAEKMTVSIKLAI